MGTYEQTMLKLEKMAQANTATQMNWQEKMSKSSHQMEVADLVKAGLNPVLSSGGNGAQSYTTSVDSAVNGIASMASSRESASATRYAARQSAAATRAAAAAQLEAARISANVASENNRRDNQTSRLNTEANIRQQRWSIENQPATNLWSAIDKATRNIGLQDAVRNSKLIKGDVKAIQTMINNPGQFLKDGVSVAKDFASLGVAGQNKINKFLKDLGLERIYSLQKLAFKATFGHSGVALQTLLKMVDRRNNSASARLLRGM